MRYKFAIFFFLTFVAANLMSQNTCPGIVTEKNILGDKFWGKCLEGNRPFLGIIEIYASEGDTFTGYFTEDGLSWEFGKYNFANEEFYLGKWENGKNEGIEYDFIGSYYWPSGEGIIGYQNDGLLNGFGMWTYGNQKNDEGTIYKYDIGEFSKGLLNGVGLRVFEVDEQEYTYIGYTKDGEFIGSIFVEQDEEVYLLDGNNLDRLENFEEYNRLYNYLNDESGKLNEIIDQYNEDYEEIERQIVGFFDDETSNPVKNSDFDRTLIKAIQNLLAKLNFDLGSIDGYLGPLTTSAIKAFQLEIGEEPDGLPSNSLLTKLQAALRSERNTQGNFSNPKESSKSQLMLASSGSGFFVSNDFIATNYHVVKSCDLLRIGNDKLEVIATDRINDIAILKSPSAAKNFLYLFQNPELGEQIYAGGYPLASSYLESFVFSQGTINSLIGLNQNVSEFQFSAPIQPGNSGGPIINRRGSAVGIIVATADEEYVKDASGALPQLINFGIKVELLKTLLDQNDIDYSEGNYFWFERDQKDLASLAKNVSVQINCFSSQ